MSKFGARLLWFSALLAGVLVAGLDTARAQLPSVGVDKRLCTGNLAPVNIATCLSGTAVATVSPYTPIFYVITLTNSGATGLVNVTDTFQPGFNFGIPTCKPTPPAPDPCSTFLSTANTLIGSTALPPGVFLGSLSLQAGQTVQIVIPGYFSLVAGGTANNSVTVTGGAIPITAVANAAVDLTPALTNDLSITKIVSPSSIDVSNGPVTVHYKVVITNVTGPNVYLGQLLKVVDELRIPTTSAPLRATFVPGSAICTPSPPSTDCLNPAPTYNASPLLVGTLTWAPFLQWRFPSGNPGLLLSGGTLTLEYDVQIERVLDCVKQQAGGDFLDNHAYFNLTTTGGITVTEQNSANNSSDTPPNTNSDVAVTTGAYIVDPDCGVTPNAPPPVLTVKKKQVSPSPVPWTGFSDVAAYQIQLKNTSATQTLTNINLRDFMREDPGTPPHDVQLVNWSCFPAPACNFVTPPPPPPGPVQSQLFYFSAKQMWSGTIAVLGPLQTVTLKITVRFTNPTCDSLDATMPNTNTNVARASYKANVLIAGVPTLVTYYLQATFTTPMKNVLKCLFDVRKQFVVPTQIGFPQTMKYNVLFRSLETVLRKVVVYDAVRVVPSNYTAGMPFTATYTCTPFPAGSVTGPIPSGTSSGIVVNTALPSQGARIFQSTGFLTFAPGATLSCNVSITVSRPLPSDPYCLGSAPGQLENLGYMTVSLIPNNNVFPPSGAYNGVWPLAASQPPAGPLSNWRSLTSLLPRCFDLVVNKTPNPTTTWTPGGPAITYTLTVTNLGDPIVSGLNKPVLTDVFSPSYVASSWFAVCSPTAPLCVFTWAPNPSANPSQLTITTLGTNQTIKTTFTVPGPFTLPAVPNTAVVTMGGPNGAQLWYPKNPTTLTANANVPVLQTNSLTVKKVISAPPGLGLPNFTGVSFPVNVVCTPYGPTPTVTPTTAAPSQVIPNIPVGSVCNVVEPPLQQTGTCGRPLVSFAMPPTYAPGQSVTITAPPASPNVAVNNVIGCVERRSLEVFKTVVNLTGGALPHDQLPVTITCSPFNNVVQLTLPDPNSAPNSLQTVSLPVGSTCTVVEGPLPPAVPPCAGTNSPAGWAPPVYFPAVPSIFIPPNPPNPQVVINNTYKCNP
jgi:Domain of unknown function (DUF5979)